MRRIFFLLLLTPFFSAAQEFGSRFISVEDGLPQSIVKDIYEDSLGYLWLATGGGLARYDGTNFETFTVDHGLPANELGALFIDRKQAIWVGTANGISKFDGRTFKNFDLLDSGQLATNIWSIAQYRDTIMFLASTGGIGKIYQDSLVSWKRQRTILQFLSFNNELLLTNFFKDSLEINYRGDTVRIRKPFHFIGSGFYKEGVLYLSTDRGVLSWKPGARELTRLLPDLHMAIYAMAHDLRYGVGQRNGRIIFFTVSETGALKFKTMPEEVRLYSSLLDREGNMWFGTNGRGVLKYYPTRFRKVHSVAKAQEIYLPIYYSSKDKKVFAGTLEDGILIFKQDSLVERINLDENPGDGKPSIRNRTRSIKSVGDTVWIATHGGLVAFTGNKHTWITSKNGLRTDTIHTMEMGADNTMWIGFFRKGMQLRQNGKFITHPVIDSAFRNARVFDLVYAPNQKKMFISTRNVVLEYNYKTNSIKEINIPGIIGNNILAERIFRERYVLLSSFGRGLFIMDAMTGTYKTVTTKHGLSSNFVVSISDDPDGRIWLGTENGINRITLDENLDVTRIEKFGKDDGLEGVRARHEAVMIADSARFFGTDEGLYSFRDFNINVRSENLLHVTNVAIDYDPNEAANYADASLPYFHVPANLNLPHDKNHVTITVNLVSKGNRQRPRYRYHLKGFDPHWSPFLTTKSITYSNLPPGSYTLLVETDQPNIKQLAYAFTIEPALYQQPAIIVLAVCLLIGLIVLGAYVRVRYSVSQFVKMEQMKSQEQERVRKELASDFHDDLGNYLVRILNYVNQLKVRRPELRDDEVIPKLEESAKILISGTKDFIWSIDLRNNSVESLYCQLKDFGEVIFENTATLFNSNLDEDVKAIKLPHHFVRQAILIFKEAMTNALKYSAASTATFSLGRENDFLRIKFNDDGQGFDAESLNAKSGLNNMALRAKKIGATIYIRSKPGNGSGVELLYPIKTEGKSYGRESFKDRVSRR